MHISNSIKHKVQGPSVSLTSKEDTQIALIGIRYSLIVVNDFLDFYILSICL